MKKSILLVAVLIALVSLCLVFASCDSGSSGDDPTPPPVPTPTTVAVESVSLDKAALVLKTGTEGTLIATVLPENATDKSVIWRSDNPEVATVDQNGKVKGISTGNVTIGTATITVTTIDGNKSASCDVSVADKVYTVSFNANGHGTVPENQYVLPGRKIEKPTDPTATGHVFQYWYKDTVTVAWDFDTDTVTEDMTLYAMWLPVYTVSFNLNGGTGTMEPVDVVAGGFYTITSPANTVTGPTIVGLPDGVVSAKEVFTGWNDGSVNKKVGDQIIVTDDIELTAQWAKPSFSVSATDKVYFAKGNLQATINASGVPTAWKFAANQYDCLGEGGANKTIGATAGDVDLFGWSIINNNWGIHTQNPGDGYPIGNFRDWGENAITNGGNAAGTWRTLSNDEWTYLLNVGGSSGRSDANRFAKAKVNGVNGLLIFPDGYNGGTAIGTVTGVANVNACNAVFPTENIPENTWTDMEKAGVVFLPAAGRRYGSNVGSVGNDGFYWSSKPYGDFSAYYLNFYNSNACISDGNRNNGYSVRLVVKANN